MQQEDFYPNIEVICRLCLKENTGTVNIFTDHHQESTENHAIMSIPMRIMACVALEVQKNDGLPKKICTECRYQLEKSYLFRKQSQASDSKLRKHTRLLSLGKSSKVFRKDQNEDDDDELEFYDSLEFIKQHDVKIKMEEQLMLENLEAKLRAKIESEFEKCKENMKTKFKEELRAEVEHSIKNELREQMQEQLEKEKIPRIRLECFQQARKSLRDEVTDDIRETEMKFLLDDLQSYLKEKQTSRPDPLACKVVVTQKIRPLSPTDNSGEPLTKRICYTDSFNKTKETSASSAKKEKYHLSQTQTPVVVKPELILSDNQSDMETNVNDDDGDSDNFLIYDTDEGFDIQKKSEGGGAEEEDDTFAEDHLQAYESSEEHMGSNNSHEGQKLSTISFRIEDIENGEVTFSKKSEILTHRDVNDDNNEQLNEANIMIINYPNEINHEEHLDIIDYANDDDRNKASKPIILKGPSVKRFRPNDSNNTGNISLTPDNYATTSTVETTLTTKTFVNTVQRLTDTPKTFKCNDCPMVFSTKQSLERHLRTHRKVEAAGVTFQCPQCHIVVSCTSALRRHMFIHCEEKPFTCLECGKSFVQKEILKRHMQTHTGIKPHKCPHCDRAFAQRINLQQHINRHHMEEPRIQQHTCHLCPKRFNHASGLSRHLASHSGVAFQCSECDRTFGDRSSIKRHIANKHGNGKIAKSDKHLENN